MCGTGSAPSAKAPSAKGEKKGRVLQIKMFSSATLIPKVSYARVAGKDKKDPQIHIICEVVAFPVEMSDQSNSHHSSKLKLRGPKEAMSECIKMQVAYVKEQIRTHGHAYMHQSLKKESK